MRGEVLHYDEDQGFGFIAGADGNHYTFAREDLRREVSMTKGTLVEFQPAGGRGRDVFPARAQTASPPANAPSQASNVPGARQPQHFGRSAERSPVTAATGLWDYFWRGLTGNYFNFAHRARRKEYWGYCLFWTIALIVVVGIGFFIDDAMSNFDELPTVTVGLCGVFVLATIPPWIGLNVRRLHDIGLTGWLFLVVLIPTIGWLIILVFALVPTQARENQWGPVPAGVNHLS